MSQYFENDNKIKSEQRLLKEKIAGYNFDFYSDNGVFAKDGVDYGTRLLIETFVSTGKSGKVLDVGSGIGVISIVLARVLNCNCDMVEINDRAIDLSLKNCKTNHVENMIKSIKSDVYENVNDKYDFIITNPPIRAGKKVVYSILMDAKNHLKENGELWFVMRKNHGLPSTRKNMEEVYSCFEIINKDKGFFICRVRG